MSVELGMQITVAMSAMGALNEGSDDRSINVLSPSSVCVSGLDYMHCH